jgi:hypothetical protein
MRAQPATPHPDRLISALAERQHGVVGRDQLIAAGLTVDAIRHRVRSRHLVPLHRGVYAVGHRRLRIEGIWMAAVLACGPGAVLSHRDAAALWDIRPNGRSDTDVTVPTTAGRSKRKGITVHRTRTLSITDSVLTRRAIPVTSPARTLIDLADVVPPNHLERAFKQTEILRLYDHKTLEAELRANPGRRGARAFTHELTRRAPRPTTRSELEDVFLALCRAHGIPCPEVNVWLGSYEADFLWREPRVIVEADSTEYHHTLSAFHDDRAKANALTAAGYRVLRFTDRQIEENPKAVADTIRKVVPGPSR